MHKPSSTSKIVWGPSSNYISSCFERYTIYTQAVMHFIGVNVWTFVCFHLFHWWRNNGARMLGIFSTAAYKKGRFCLHIKQVFISDCPIFALLSFYYFPFSPFDMTVILLARSLKLHLRKQSNKNAYYHNQHQFVIYPNILSVRQITP